MDITKEVQGVAVYAEFARANATTQIIITPDGFDNAGNKVQMNLIRRTVTSDNPRKQWRFSPLPEADEHLVAGIAGTSASTESKEAYSDERFRYAASLFEQILRGEWAMIGEPVLLEVSKTDLDVIRLSKTPTKLIYRINQSRIAKGFPTELVNASVPTPHPATV